MDLEIFSQCDICACLSVPYRMKNFSNRVFNKKPVNTDVNFLPPPIELVYYGGWCYLPAFNDKMQGDPYKVKESEKKGQTQETHSINCTCPNCRRKYGSLPLLVQVIEGQERSKQKTEQKPNTSTESMPSTSGTSMMTKKEIKCPNCDKSFTHKGDYNKHFRTHTGEQPYVCPTCNRRFAHTSNLSRHQRVHSGDKPFTCDVCHKNFSRMDKLKLHKNSKLCKKSSANT